MGVTRYRDVADMPPPARLDPADRRSWQRIKELWRSASRLLPPLFEPGVIRYRSIEESKAARDRATLRRMRAVRAARRIDR